MEIYSDSLIYMQNKSYLNKPKEFHLEMPLYYIINIKEEDISKEVHSLMAYSGVIDAYCTWCKDRSIFGTGQFYPHEFQIWKYSDNGIKTNRYSCSRDSSHEYIVYYLKTEDSIQKIGQFPSVADFQIPQAEKYRTVLGEDLYKELTKAIGLKAHGVGVGSCVYLRRIFENLISEAYAKAKSNERFDNDKYSKAKMDEKIKILEEDLPSFLVENRKIYSILSKGLHELNEDECLKYFEAVKIGIEQILDEKIEKNEKIRKATEDWEMAAYILGYAIDLSGGRIDF